MQNYRKISLSPDRCKTKDNNFDLAKGNKTRAAKIENSETLVR